jgi:multiple sugar transport system substrate-binding protein
MKRLVVSTCIAWLAALPIGCGPTPANQAGPSGTETGDGAAPARSYQPIEPKAIVLWDRQTTETADLLRQLTTEFNAERPGLQVTAQYSGGYTEIFQKVMASIQAGKLPAMAVAYQSMTSEYIEAGAVVALDTFVDDPDVGLTPEDRDDFFPSVLETNRFAEYGGKMYSFPFCKSVLMMYFNKRLLAEAGIENPPATWDAFLQQCRQIKAKTGKHAYAVNVDASTIDGMIFSMGGDVVSGRESLFDSPEAIRVFELIETLARENLAYQITPRTEDDKIAFAANKVAFFFRSSSHRTSTAEVMQGNLDDWGMAMIPQADPANPRTVLYGPNICVFKTVPEQERAAWEFVKFFTSPESTVRWALESGYVPTRKSAADDPKIQAFWAEWEYNRTAYDCLPHARSEPMIAGWQRIRSLIENAETAVLTGLKTGAEAARDLKREADTKLKKR